MSIYSISIIIYYIIITKPTSKQHKTTTDLGSPDQRCHCSHLRPQDARAQGNGLELRRSKPQQLPTGKKTTCSHVSWMHWETMKAEFWKLMSIIYVQEWSPGCSTNQHLQTPNRAALQTFISWGHDISSSDLGKCYHRAPGTPKHMAWNMLNNLPGTPDSSQPASGPLRDGADSSATIWVRQASIVYSPKLVAKAK